MQTVPAPVTAALDALDVAGYAAYLVGGCVRDALRGEKPDDYDIATDALPRQVVAVFGGARVIETGLKHGTVTVLSDGIPLEITTFRTESGYADHRRPDRVAFTGSLSDDLARRDFTVNAMAWSPRRGLVDPFGGTDDLRAGLLRCVGDPTARFTEDALRILRLLRFAAKLGFSVEAETAAAARALAPTLAYVSAERIHKELTQLLCASDAERVLLDFPDVVCTALPELSPTVGFAQHHPRHAYDVWTHCVKTLAAAPPEPALRWAALLHDAAKPACYSEDAAGVGHFYGHAKQSAVLADALLTRLRFDLRSQKQIVRLIALHDVPLEFETPEQTERAIKRLLGRLGEEDFFLLLALKRADLRGQGVPHPTRPALYDAVEALARRILAQAACFSLRDLAVKGSDLLALGYRGPAVGQALQALLDAVIDDRAPNEKAALLAYLASSAERA